MSIIQVYDIASSTWKTQKATAKDGDSPRRRKGFCAVVMSAQDHSSHQIYFYGGNPSDSTTGPILDDVWVLTLPSFQFIKVSNSAEAARASGTCMVISPQYLLAYRGESYVGSDGVNLLGDASLALLDLTDLKWKTEYTPANTSTVYRVPQKVIEVIGGEYVLLICTMVKTVYLYYLVKPAMQQQLPRKEVLMTNPSLLSSTFRTQKGLLRPRFPPLHPCSAG